MELKVKGKVKLEDGIHTGEIIGIDYRDEPYKYTDIFLKVDGVEDETFSIKYGCPTNLREGTKLYKLVSKFEQLKIDQTVDVNQILVGKKVQFQTLTEETAKGDFARIVDGSIKPR